MYNFGDKLKELRLDKKLSQKLLASKINVSESMVCRYEKGEVYPPLETLRSLSAILGVSLDELCGTQTRGTVSLYGLNAEQAEIIKNLILAFRKHNDAFKKSLNTEQCAILGQIVAEFSKKTI